MENNKTKKPKVIWEKKTSKFVFGIPIILVFALLVYTINNKLNSDLFLYIIIILGISAKFFLLYYKKKIVLTEKKIYIYNRGKKFISWSLQEDFYIVNYKQSLLGKLFDFGTLTIINKNKDMYEYYFLEEPRKTYENIVETYEILMKKLDPNFIVSYKDNKDSSIDSIDTIEVDNEK